MSRADNYSYSYESDLTPEEKIEMLYSDPVEQFSRIGRLHSFEWKLKRRYNDIAKIRQEIPKGGEDEPFHSRVWFPHTCWNTSLSTDSSLLKRRKKKKRKTNTRDLLSLYPPNMALICAGFLGESDESGPAAELRLQQKQFQAAMNGLGIHETDVIMKAFRYFGKTPSEGGVGYVIFDNVITCLSNFINNNSDQNCTLKCFELFSGLGGNLHYSKLKPKPEFDGQDYIHAEQLSELRRLRNANRMPPRSHLMVKVLLEVFSSARKAEEQKFLLNMGRGKKGGKKKPPSIAPLRLRDEMRDFHRSRHISFSDFRESMNTNPDVVVAFFPIYLSELISLSSTAE